MVPFKATTPLSILLWAGSTPCHSRRPNSFVKNVGNGLSPFLYRVFRACRRKKPFSFTPLVPGGHSIQFPRGAVNANGSQSHAS